MTAVTDCSKDIEVISKMYLVFINPAKFLVAIHAVMSQKFGFACSDGNALEVRLGEKRGGRWTNSECTNRGKSIFGTGSSQAATSRDEIHCGQREKYLKTQLL